MITQQENIIVHYHLFKNAGTSVDHLLRQNFAEKWMSYDGEKPGDIITATELSGLVENNRDKVAFSSHQIVPPLPAVEANVFPIVFIRDPIDRIKSAYLFEWKKQPGLEEPKGSLAEYVRSKFKHRRKSSVEDFQTIRMANLSADRFDSLECDDDEMLGRACEFISSIGFVGIVDEFEQSKQLLERFLKPAFPAFELSEVKANVLQDLSLSAAQKRVAIKNELGETLFEEIVQRNILDEKLYQFARARFNELCAVDDDSLKQCA